LPPIVPAKYPAMPTVPVHELNLLRNPFRLEGKAAAAFRKDAAVVVSSYASSISRSTR